MSALARIAQIEQERRAESAAQIAAQQAEREKAERLAQRDYELDNLKRQASAESIGQAVQTYQGLFAAHTEAARRLTADVGAPVTDWAACHASCVVLQAAIDRCLTFAERAASQAANLLPAFQPDPNLPDWKNEEGRLNSGRVYQGYRAKMLAPKNILEILSEWAGSAAPGQERQRRAGIVYGLTGVPVFAQIAKSNRP